MIEKQGDSGEYIPDVEIKTVAVKGSQGKIVLIPQPSDDPRDPLVCL